MEVEYGTGSREPAIYRGHISGIVVITYYDGLYGGNYFSGVDGTVSENSFWGSFETSQSGFNEFKVMLTGPDASELIGSWAVPIMIDGEPHQLMGAWIAARG